MQNNQVQENYARIQNNIAEAALKSGRTPEEISFMAVTKTVAPPTGTSSGIDGTCPVEGVP